MNVTYARRKGLGICIDCGEVPPVKGGVRCQPCREINAERNRNYPSRRNEKEMVPVVTPRTERMAELTARVQRLGRQLYLSQKRLA